MDRTGARPRGGPALRKGIRMDVLLTGLGLALVALGLWDVFLTLLHPRSRGTLSHGVLRLVWRLSRRSGHRHGSLAGPLGVVGAIVLWALLQAAGWALVYVPHVPDGLAYAQQAGRTQHPDATEALYLSLVTLGTLGFGDVVPDDPWLRIAVPVESLIGFALLTGALSWFTQIHPALAQRRALAVRLSLLRGADYARRLPGLETATARGTLDGLTGSVVDARVALVQNAETYYFRETEEDATLAVLLPYAMELATRAEEARSEDVRLSGSMLRAAVEDLGRLLREEFRGRGETTEEVLGAWAADHGFGGTPGGSGRPDG